MEPWKALVQLTFIPVPEKVPMAATSQDATTCLTLSHARILELMNTTWLPLKRPHVWPPDIVSVTPKSTQATAPIFSTTPLNTLKSPWVIGGHKPILLRDVTPWKSLQHCLTVNQIRNKLFFVCLQLHVIAVKIHSQNLRKVRMF